MNLHQESLVPKVFSHPHCILGNREELRPFPVQQFKPHQASRGGSHLNSAPPQLSHNLGNGACSVTLRHSRTIHINHKAISPKPHLIVLWLQLLTLWKFTDLCTFLCIINLNEKFLTTSQLIRAKNTTTICRVKSVGFHP